MGHIYAAALPRLRPFRERPRLRPLRHCSQELPRVSAGRELARDQVTANAGLSHCRERAAMLDWIRATTEAEADGITAPAPLRFPHRDRCARHRRLLSARETAEHGD